jgi:hypothetical protein
MSLPMMTAEGRLMVAPQMRRNGRSEPVCRVRLECRGGHRATWLNVDLVGPSAPTVAASLAAGDYAVATGHLANRTSRDGHLLYTLMADDLRRIDVPEVAA